jgi:hypothetical protein
LCPFIFFFNQTQLNFDDVSRAKVRVSMTAGKVRVSKRARETQPLARCISGYFCSTCKPDYNMALAMGTHERLGQASPLASLTDDLLLKIIDGTEPRRQVPAWMSCTWSARKARKIARTAHSSSGV